MCIRHLVSANQSKKTLKLSCEQALLLSQTIQETVHLEHIHVLKATFGMLCSAFWCDDDTQQDKKQHFILLIFFFLPGSNQIDNMDIYFFKLKSLKCIHLMVSIQVHDFARPFFTDSQ